MQAIPATLISRAVSQPKVSLPRSASASGPSTSRATGPVMARMARWSVTSVTVTDSPRPMWLTSQSRSWVRPTNAELR